MSSTVRNRALTFFALGIALTAPIAASAQSGKLPPLIDRELFFGNPEISGAQISPDGKYIAFLKPYKDTRNVWVKRTTEPFTAAKLVTTDTKRPIPSFFWSRDGKYILFVQDKRGDENFNVYAVDPGGARPPGRSARRRAISPTARASARMIYAVPEERSRHHLRRHQRSRQILARSLQGQDLDRREDAAAQEHRADRRLGLRSTRASCGSPRAPPTTATPRSCASTPNGFTKIYSCTVFESCGPDRFNKDDTARLHGDEQGRSPI